MIKWLLTKDISNLNIIGFIIYSGFVLFHFKEFLGFAIWIFLIIVVEPFLQGLTKELK